MDEGQMILFNIIESYGWYCLKSISQNELAIKMFVWVRTWFHLPAHRSSQKLAGQYLEFYQQSLR